MGSKSQFIGSRGFADTKGADVHFVCPGGGTLLHVATHRTKQFIEDDSDDVSVPQPETEKDREKKKAIMSILLNCGINPNEKDRSGRTPLFGVYCSELAKILITAGADVNAKNKYGQTPLFLAADIEIVKVLIEAGADVNTRNQYGESPLCCHGSQQIKDLLVKNGACDAGKYSTQCR